jgi:hypothetical protein
MCIFAPRCAFPGNVRKNKARGTSQGISGAQSHARVQPSALRLFSLPMRTRIIRIMGHPTRIPGQGDVPPCNGRRDVLPTVRVKLRIVNCNHAEPLPPDGVTEGWWQRLKGALGSSSNDFVRASLIQLQSAARLPCSGISELAVNAALALIEAAQPRNELEAALAVQMACTHCAAVAILARLGAGHGSERRVVALASAAARLLSAYAAQMEALRRLRHGGRAGHPDRACRRAQRPPSRGRRHFSAVIMSRPPSSLPVRGPAG